MSIHMKTQQEPEYVTLDETAENINQTMMNCKRCKAVFDSQEALQKYETEHDDAMNTCQVCEIVVKDTQLSVRCENCEFVFHKKCTNDLFGFNPTVTSPLAPKLMS